MATAAATAAATAPTAVAAAAAGEHKTARNEAHERMALAVQRSRDMVCAVCLEVVFDKDDQRKRRFGILPNCSHCYCLECIRTWRSGKNVRSCPVCRTRSQFFVPSDYWVEDGDDKRKLIQKYKDYMASKPCRNFDQGRGTCPFGSKCFYKHEALPQTWQPWRGSDFTEPSPSGFRSAIDVGHRSGPGAQPQIGQPWRGSDFTEPSPSGFRSAIAVGHRSGRELSSRSGSPGGGRISRSRRSLGFAEPSPSAIEVNGDMIHLFPYTEMMLTLLACSED